MLRFYLTVDEEIINENNHEFFQERLANTFMRSMNTARAFVKPNGITVNSK
jgi:hypothetical protein